MNQNTSPLPAPTTPATITLSDGKERTLRFSLAAMKRLRKVYGDALFGKDAVLKFFVSDSGQIEFDRVAAIALEGLRHGFEGGEADLTIERVEDLISIEAMPTVYVQILKALGTTFKKPPEKNLEAPPMETAALAPALDISKEPIN